MEIWIYVAEIFRDNKHRKDKVFLLLEYMQNVFSLSLNPEILYLTHNSVKKEHILIKVSEKVHQMYIMFFLSKSYHKMFLV